MRRVKEVLCSGRQGGFLGGVSGGWQGVWSPGDLFGRGGSGRDLSGGLVTGVLKGEGKINRLQTGLRSAPCLSHLYPVSVGGRGGETLASLYNDGKTTG